MAGLVMHTRREPQVLSFKYYYVVLKTYNILVLVPTYPQHKKKPSWTPTPTRRNPYPYDGLGFGAGRVRVTFCDPRVTRDEHYA